MCESELTIFSNCKKDDENLFCIESDKFTAASVAIVLGALACILVVTIGFVQERSVGFVSLFATISIGVGLYLWTSAMSNVEATGYINLLTTLATSEQLVLVDRSRNFSFSLSQVAALLCCAAVVSSLSLFFFWLDAEGPLNHIGTTPEIQVIEMDVAAAQRMAPSAPQPGFVAIQGKEDFELHPHDEAVEEGEEIISSLPSEVDKSGLNEREK